MVLWLHPHSNLFENCGLAAARDTFWVVGSPGGQLLGLFLGALGWLLSLSWALLGSSWSTFGAKLCPKVAQERKKAQKDSERILKDLLSILSYQIHAFLLEHARRA